MRCITPVLLLLPPLLCAATTVVSSSAVQDDDATHTSSIGTNTETSLSSSSSSAEDSHTTSVSTSVLLASSSSKATKKATVDSPLVFLPQTSETACPSRTVNYITHTLPQQCLRTDRTTVGSNSTAVEGGARNATVSDGQPASTAVDGEPVNTSTSKEDGATEHSGGEQSTAGEPVKTASIDEAVKLGLEDEHESPLDDSKFLSFEEWKKQNLAKAGQSPENVKQGRPQGGEGRRRPINNALDSLGDEGEIELDFVGFGDGGSKYTPSASPSMSVEADTSASEESAHASPARHRSKDAGKTCKERFNYASFDCAATVMKTNPRAKSSSAVLVENKDSYMLNECSVQNKFIIVELCDDILVDTVVVANFEFFSSMFRIFRVSVSDRYPVKADRWKELGTFEARNSREIQAFLVENPLIWARYLRIEFLTHYGSEFYCPLSLVRVHGTTMMEEFRHQEDEARGEDDVEELVPDVEVQSQVATETATVEPIPEASAEPVHVDEKTAEEPSSTLEEPVAKGTQVASARDASVLDSEPLVSAGNGTAGPTLSATAPEFGHTSSSDIDDALDSTPTEAVVVGPATSSEGSSSVSTSSGVAMSAVQSLYSNASLSATSSNATSSIARAPSSNATTSVIANNATLSTTKTLMNTTEVKASIASAATASAKSNKPVGTEAVKSPPPPQPSTQESFFKMANKRLTQLETNSSLNIQYIEEQSRILRDAFVQTEKHQLKKTENFLKHLNDTVMSELKGFRTQYDQLWQSTVIELEEGRARSQKEMMAFSARLTMLADELVWAKRMNVVQSVLLLLILGLFVFAQKGKEYMDMPIMQQALKRSQSVLRFNSRNRSFDSPSPPASPESMRASSPEFIRQLRQLGPLNNPSVDDVDIQTRPTSQGSDILLSEPLNTNSADHASPITSVTNTPNGHTHPPPSINTKPNPDLTFEPPTPDPSDTERSPSPTLSPVELARAIVREAQSGPATPSGSRGDQPPVWDGAAADGEAVRRVLVDGRGLAKKEARVQGGKGRLLRGEHGSGNGRGPSPLRCDHWAESDVDAGREDEDEAESEFEDEHVAQSIEHGDVYGDDDDDDDDASPAYSSDNEENMDDDPSDGTRGQQLGNTDTRSISRSDSGRGGASPTGRRPREGRKDVIDEG